MAAAKHDEIKATMAKALQDALLKSFGSESERALDIMSAEVTPVTPLQTQIRVRTRNAGTRYFLIAFKETF